MSISIATASVRARTPVWKTVIAGRAAALVAALAVAAPAALAEDILSADGMRAVPSLEEKVRLSRASASYVAAGRFAPRQPDAPMQALDHDKGVLSLDFVPDRAFHGTPPGRSVKLVAYLPAPGVEPNVTTAMLAASAQLERAHSGHPIAVERYRTALAQVRRPLLHASGYLRDFVIVPVAAGSLDTPYRIADVVVRFDRRYVLLVLRELPERDQALMPNELDLYEADDTAVRAVLAAQG